MRRLTCFIVLAMLGHNAWALDFVPPGPSTTGNYRVQWSTPLGCGEPDGQGFADCYGFYEYVNESFYPPSSGTGGANYWDFAGQTAGTYYYAVGHYVNAFPEYIDAVEFGGIVVESQNVSFDLWYQTGTEGGQVIFTVTKVGSTSQTTGVSYYTQGGDGAYPAISDVDFAATSGTLSFAWDETSKQFTVDTLQDNIDEYQEMFRGFLYNPTGPATIGMNGVPAQIADDDPIPTASIGNAATTEDGNLSFNITLSNPAVYALSVYPAFSGTATSGTDYAAYCCSYFTFNALETSKNLVIDTSQDSVFEGNETITATLSSIGGAPLIGNAVGTGTITDDDTVTFAISDVSATEGNALGFTVTQTGASVFTHILNFATTPTGATATAGTDYTATSGSRTFNPTSAPTQTLFVSVATLDESPAQLESGETVLVDLTPNSLNYATISDSRGVGTINDDDVGFSISDVSVVEGNATGGTLAFTVTKSGNNGATNSVQYATSNGSATSGSDYPAVGLTTLSFTSGQTTQTVNIAVTGDTTSENHETLNVNLSNGSTDAAITDAQGIGTINNDDAPSTSGLTGPLGITGTTTSATLTWSTSGVVSYHEVERTFDGVVTTVNTGSTNTSYSATGLSTNGPYRFRVRGCNSAGNYCGAWSNGRDVVKSNVDTATGVPSLLSGSSDAGPSTGLTTDFNGTVGGQAGVAPSGAATYTIPISIPPGTRGVQPSLALVYNSHTGTGSIGRGWALAGAGGAVTRCGTTLAQDPVIHPVDYTANDRFCLDGQRLVMVTAGTYGGDGMRYRTEVESFRDVVSNGGTASSPNSFTVRTRDGQTLSYGGTSGSNFQASAPNGAQVAAWLLRRVEDKFGNYYDITYVEDEANGDYRASRIDYTGHSQTPVTTPYASVELSYEALANPIKRYQAGSVISVRQRLTKIAVKNGATPVREYVLGYDAGETALPSAMSRLTSVKECAPTEASAVCTAPTTFDWVNDVGGLGPVQTVTAPSGGNIPEFHDLNGDGKADMVHVYGTSQQVVFEGTETGLQLSSYTWDAPFGANGNSIFKFADVDGDGDDDFIRLSTTWNTQDVFKSTGAGYAARQAWGASMAILSGYAFAELNGDGRTDFVTWDNNSATDTIIYYVNYSTGSGYSSTTWAGPKLSNGTPGWQPETFSFHDVNGDGRADLVLVKGATHRIYVNNSMGFGSYFEATTPAAMPGALWADVNGDSLLDYSDGTTTAIWTGKEYVSWGTSYAGGWGPRDMNGDGLTDQVDGNSIQFSTGSGYTTSAAWAGFQMPGNLYVQFPDFDGDGKPDVKIGLSTVNYQINQSAPAHLMARVTDGFGLQTTFTYKPLSSSAAHTKLTNATYPTADIANAVHVVTQMSEPDGIGGTFDTTYKYKGFRVDTLGRGSLGFAEVTAEDVDRKVKTVTTYSQTFPFIGLPTSIDVTITDKLDNGSGVAQLISDVDRTYAVRNGVAATSGPPIKLPCIDTDTTLEYDVESGVLLRTVFADNTPTGGAPCDDFGNLGEPGTPDGSGTPLNNRVTVTDHVAEPDVVYRGDSVTYYLNDQTSWYFGLPTRQTTKPFVDGVGDATKDRTTAVSYVAGKGVVFQIIREPDGSAPIKLTTEFEYDLFGNRKKETITPSETGGTPTPPQMRIERVDFDAATGRFPAVLTNAEGHVTNLSFDPRFGVIATADGPNATVGTFNDSATRTFDAFGRMKDERRPDGSYQVVYFKTVAAGASGSPGTNAKVMVETSLQNTAWGVTPATRLTPVRTFLDGLGRELRTRSRAFDATNFVHIDTIYDSRGRVFQSSEPYFEGQTPTWNTPAYDVLNRTVGMTAADATQSTTTDYSAFTVTTMDSGGRQNRLIADALGRTVRTDNFDAVGTVRATTEYVYDKAGNVTTVRKLGASGAIANTVITNTFDRLGRRLSTTDPDYGIVGGTTADGLITFQFDSMGDLRRQQTPRLRQQSASLYTELDYDRLGRLRTRRDPANDLVQTVLSTFTFDETPSMPDDCQAGVGQLTTEQISGGGEPGLTTTYCYSPAQFGRLTFERSTTNSVPYQTNYTYDVLGRLSQVRYPASSSAFPSRYAVNYLYTPRGALERVQEAQSPNTVLYQTTGANSRGQIEKEYLGDGSRTTRKFVKDTERLAFTNAAIGSSQLVQNFVYGYDAIGNISGRGDLINSVSETFGYDYLDRLTASTVTNGTGPHPVTYAYDDTAGNLGNMTHKSDISTLASASMSYSTTARPHALTALNTGSGTRTFTYDANGRMTAGQVSSTARTLTYTSYDLLASAAIGTTSRTFRYGADRQRYLQTSVSGGVTRTYTYIGEHYVSEAQSGSATEYKLYIMANGEPVAYVSDDGTPETKYLHKDSLGSITTIITNQNFAGREKLSYDVWGKRRHGTDWWSAPAAATEERGYTGHEHLDNVNLIHMNGRAYDAQLARFTSPDPFVPAPLYSQSYNRYAYVYNSPLKFIDPSGYRPRDSDYDHAPRDRERCDRVNGGCLPGGALQPGPWDGPPATDDGFEWANPQDWAYYFQQQALQEWELQRAYATYLNDTLSMNHPAAKTDQGGLPPFVSLQTLLPSTNSANVLMCMAGVTSGAVVANRPGCISDAALSKAQQSGPLDVNLPDEVNPLYMGKVHYTPNKKNKGPITIEMTMALSGDIARATSAMTNIVKEWGKRDVNIVFTPTTDLNSADLVIHGDTLEDIVNRGTACSCAGAEKIGGTGYYWDRGGPERGNLMTVNGAVPASARADAHEFGHKLGLRHRQSGSIMGYPGTGQTGVSKWDARRLRALYPQRL